MPDDESANRKGGCQRRVSSLSKQEDYRKGDASLETNYGGGSSGVPLKMMCEGPSTGRHDILEQ